jgi:hypothetical protein
MFLARLARYADAEPRKLRPLADKVASWRARTGIDRERKPTLGAGACLACGRWVHGTAEDRLRSGMCEAHYKAWCRAGRPERGAFMASTPMWDNEWGWADPGHTRIISPKTLMFLEQDFYKQIGKTAATDYRSVYRANWRVKAMQEKDFQFFWVLQALK